MERFLPPGAVSSIRDNGTEIPENCKGQWPGAHSPCLYQGPPGAQPRPAASGSLGVDSQCSRVL